MQEQAIRDSIVTSHKPIKTHTMRCSSQQNLPLLPCHSVGGENTVIQTVFSPLLPVHITAVQTLPPKEEKCAERWVTSLELCPRCHLLSWMTVSSDCMAALPSVAEPGDFLSGTFGDWHVSDKMERDLPGQSSEWHLVVGASPQSYMRDLPPPFRAGGSQWQMVRSGLMGGKLSLINAQ